MHSAMFCSASLSFICRLLAPSTLLYVPVFLSAVGACGCHFPSPFSDNVLGVAPCLSSSLPLHLSLTILLVYYACFMILSHRQMKYYYYYILGREPERGPETAHQSSSLFLLSHTTCYTGRSIFLYRHIIVILYCHVNTACDLSQQKSPP